MRFVHESLPQRVVFALGEAAAGVVAEVTELGRSSVLLITSDRGAALAEPVQAALEAAGLAVTTHNEVVMHVPVAVAERARGVAAAVGADVVVTVGGGSTTGLGKGVVMDGSPVAGIPLIAVPTTYAGSEATNVWGLTEGETKTTGVDPRVLPASIVYDATLLTSLPGDMTVASGLNALAHGVDAMWGPRVDPIDQAMAQEGIRGLAAGLPKVAADPAGVDGIEETLYGAYLSAVAFAGAGSGMHHKICHVLGGMFNLPHAQTHACVLPHVLAFNAPNAPDAERRIAAAFGAGAAREVLPALRAELARHVEVPHALKDYGMPEDGIAQALEPITAAIPATNPTLVTDDNLTALLWSVWNGDLP